MFYPSSPPIDDHLFKVSVKEMVESRCPELKERREGDILGPLYRMPDNSAYLLKPREFKISNS
jgi:hypothetical protein